MYVIEMNNNDNINLLDIRDIGKLQWNVVEDITEVIEKEDGEKNACRELCVLEQIFPPRVWTTYEDEENVSTTWRQTISRELPTRRDLTEIINTLYDHERFNNVKNKKLWDEKRGLYKLLFDEILRQILITNEDLGVILYRVRNEFMNMIFISKILLENAMIFTEEYSNSLIENKELIDEVEKLTEINDDTTLQCRLASQKYSRALKGKDEIDECQVIAEENHAKEMDCINRSIVKLREQMTLMTPPKDNI